MTNVSKVDMLMQGMIATADMTTQKNTENSFQAAFDRASINAGVDVTKELDTTTGKATQAQHSSDTATDHYKKNESVAEKAKVKVDDASKASTVEDNKHVVSDNGMAKEANEIDDKTNQLAEAEEAVADIKEVIAEKLGISIEDLDKLLETMEITVGDLLNVNVVPSIVMEANGETDSVALVTNENLMNTVEELKADVTEILSNLEEVTGESTEVIANRMNESIKELVNDMTAVSSEESAQIIDKINLADTTVNQNLDIDDSSDIVDSNDRVNPAEVQVSDVRTTETNEVYEKTAISQTVGQGEKLEQTKETEEKPDVSDRVVEAQKTQGDVAVVSDDKSEAGKKNGFGSESKEKSQPETNFSTNIESKIDQILNEQQVEAKAEAQHVNTQDIIDQITEHMKLNVRNNMTEIDMQLNPESLGTLHIRVAAKEGVITAQFTTQSEEVKAVIQSQIAELTQKLENENVKIQAVEVTVESHAFEENLSRGNDQQQNEENTPKRRPVRRLEIRPGMTLDEIAELDEADQLTAEMMALEGNSVDYQA